MGLGGNKFQDKVSFVTVTVVRNRNGRIITKDRHTVGKSVPVNVVEVPLNPTDGFFQVFDADDRDGCVRDTLFDCGSEGLDDGWIHDGGQSARDRMGRQRKSLKKFQGGGKGRVYWGKMRIGQGMS